MELIETLEVGDMAIANLPGEISEVWMVMKCVHGNRYWGYVGYPNDDDADVYQIIPVAEVDRHSNIVLDCGC